MKNLKRDTKKKTLGPNQVGYIMNSPLENKKVELLDKLEHAE